MKVHTYVLAGLMLGVLSLSVPTALKAQTEIGGQLGRDFDNSDLFIGANAVFETPFTLGEQDLKLNPEFSYYFVDEAPGSSSSFWQLNVFALYPLSAEVADVYLGAGIGISHSSFSFDARDALSKGGIVVADHSESSTNFGLTGKAGASIGGGIVKPIVEFGFVISKSSWLFGQIGARYTL